MPTTPRHSSSWDNSSGLEHRRKLGGAFGIWWQLVGRERNAVYRLRQSPSRCDVRAVLAAAKALHRNRQLHQAAACAGRCARYRRATCRSARSDAKTAPLPQCPWSVLGKTTWRRRQAMRSGPQLHPDDSLCTGLAIPRALACPRHRRTMGEHRSKHFGCT